MTDPTTPPSSPGVALITGAGSGVGRETAVLLAEWGYTVVLVARTEAALHQTADRIRADCGDDATIDIQPTDITDPDAITALVQGVVDRHGRLDVLCNVAGSAPLQPIHKVDAQVFDDCIAVNLKGPTLLIAAAWPHFRKQKAGTVVNVSSMASLDPFTGFNVYAAAKAGINLLTKAIADEGKKFNVRAVAIAPGAIETPMLRENFPEKAIPKDKTLAPDQVAALIRDCVTGEYTFDNGGTVALPSP